MVTVNIDTKYVQNRKFYTKMKIGNINLNKAVLKLCLANFYFRRL